MQIALLDGSIAKPEKAIAPPAGPVARGECLQCVGKYGGEPFVFDACDFGFVIAPDQVDIDLGVLYGDEARVYCDVIFSAIGQGSIAVARRWQSRSGLECRQRFQIFHHVRMAVIDLMKYAG